MTARAVWLLALASAVALLALVYFGEDEQQTGTRQASEAVGHPDPTRSTQEAPRPKQAVAKASTPAAAPALPDPERLLRELEPLAVTDKPRALALALAADATLPADGVMAEARRALIVTLMVDTDRMSDARERARAFIRQYPDSPYLPIVKGTTGVHPRPRPSEMRDAQRP